MSTNASTWRQRARQRGSRCGAIAALYIRKRRPTTKQVSTITANGACAAMSCVARICAAPEKTIIAIPTASSADRPVACAATPQTSPNGRRPISGGVMSRMPATKSGREKWRDTGPVAQRGEDAMLARLARRRRGDRAGGQPLTPPAVSPPTTRSWNTAIMMQIGTSAMISAAEMSGHGNANSPW